MKQLWLFFVVVGCLVLSTLNCKNNSDSPTSPPIIPPATPKITRAELYVPEDTSGFVPLTVTTIALTLSPPISIRTLWDCHLV